MADKSLSLVLGVGKFHECYFPQSNKLVKTKQKFYLLYSSSQKFSSVSSTYFQQPSLARNVRGMPKRQCIANK